MRAIEIFVLPDVQLLDATGPLQVFATANDLLRDAHDPPAYAPRLISPDGGIIRSSSGLEMVTSRPRRGAIDTLIVAGGVGMRAATDDAARVAWLAAQLPRARRVASVCTGAFLLAATGALDGRRAATHWAHAAMLASRFPAVRVEPDPIWIRDDPVWTSAGVTAGIDLALALVEDDLGPPLSLAVARQLVVFVKRQGGQSQFSDALAQQQAAAPFETLIAWITGNLKRDLSVPALARRAGMSERSFLRHWRAHTGTTPARTVERLRIEAARRALTDTAQPIKRIATRCGFGTTETMRRGFQKHLAVSPQDFRDRFTASTR